MVSAAAIDVGWLRSIEDLTDRAHWDAVDFLVDFSKSDCCLLLDVEERILNEYERVLTGNMVGARFFSVMNEANKVEYRDGSLSNACRTALAADGFDRDDLPYVGVCEGGIGLYLTHESKHLEEDRQDICSRMCGVEIVDWPTARSMLPL